MATGCDIVVPRGDKQRVNVTVQDDDGQTVNLADSSIDEVALTVASQPHHLDQDTEFSLTATNLSSSGMAVFTVNQTDTEDLTTGLYFYEIRVKYNGNQNYTAVTSGRFFVKPRVTQ